MKTFSNQIDLTAYWEQGPNGGPALKAYRCPAGKLTIGYGETLPDGGAIKEGMICTEHQATTWLINTLTYLEVFLQKKLGFIALGENKYDALKDYAYNAGINAFPSLLMKLKVRDIQAASLEFLDGLYVGKKPLLGLLLRRISEYNTFVNGTYIAWEKGDPISQDLKNKLLAKNAKNQDAVNMINQLKVQGGK